MKCLWLGKEIERGDSFFLIRKRFVFGSVFPAEIPAKDISDCSGILKVPATSTDFGAFDYKRRSG